jgi:multidrug/hemolysin transport system permease protein
MPISSFGEGLQRLLSFLPGTYGTSLVRNHAMRGALEELETVGVPREAIDAARDAMDCNLYFFDQQVGEGVMYAILGGAVILLVAVYVLMNLLRKNRQPSK